MGDAHPNGQDTRGTLRAVVLAFELVAAAAIAAWALVNVWTLAHPSGDGTVCPLIYPAPPGCSPQDRFTPAFVSAVVVSVGRAPPDLVRDTCMNPHTHSGCRTDALWIFVNHLWP